MARRNAKLSDDQLAGLFEKAATLESYPGARKRDYAWQESVIAAVNSRIDGSPVLQASFIVEKIGHLLTEDDRVLPGAKVQAIHALAKAGSAVNARTANIESAVYALRWASLSSPEHAKMAEKAIKSIAIAHPDDWQESYNHAAAMWHKTVTKRQAENITLEIMRHEAALKLA